MGIHAVNCLVWGNDAGQPDPPWLLRRMIGRFVRKAGVTPRELEAWAGLLTFELGWWKSRGWLRARSFAELVELSAGDGFDVRSRLLSPRTVAARQELVS